jgi:hypothetical protein
MSLVKVLLCTFAVSVVAAGPAPAQQTGFETRRGADWTTYAEEQAYLAQLDAAQERLRVSQIATTKQGRAMHLVQVDVRRPRPLKQVARRSSILFVCSQHGNEPAGREACLQLMGELTTTHDPELVAGLRRTTVLFVPNANPDGREANTRDNPDGVNVNRDYLEYASIEARAIGEIIRDYKPDLVHDLHEFPPGILDRQVTFLWPRNLNVDRAIYELSLRLSTKYLKDEVEAAGYSSGVYGIDRDGRPIPTLGDQDERILRNYAGLRHSLSILIESNWGPTTPEEAADPRVLNVRRVASQIVPTKASLRFVRDFNAEVRRATRRAPALKTIEGRRQHEPVFFGGADNDPPAPEEVDVTPPCRYDLDAAQAAFAAPLFAIHGIRTERRRGRGVSVPLAQPAEPFIPLLLDARAPHSPLDLPEVEDCGKRALKIRDAA